MIRSFIILACCLFLAAPAYAASNTMGEAAAATFDDANSGPGALKKLGAKPTKILVAERLPDGTWAVEHGFELDGKQGRIAMRLKDAPGGWRPAWVPVTEYGAALGNLLQSGSLPASESERAWSQLQRLPAFPVIVTKKRAVTPFGVLEKDDEATATDRFQRGRPKPTGPLPTSQALARHAERWIKEVLADDPGPAGLDLIVDSSISWQRFNAALFSVAGVGLYMGEIVAAGKSDWVSIPFAAPIAAATGKVPPALVLAYYPGEQFGFRVVFEKAPVPTTKGCPEPMAICGESAESFEPGLRKIVGKKPVQRVMFASGGKTTTADAIGWVERTNKLLGLAPHRLFLGFIAQ